MNVVEVSQKDCYYMAAGRNIIFLRALKNKSQVSQTDEIPGVFQ
mgnify:CR=1 FL=1